MTSRRTSPGCASRVTTRRRSRITTTCCASRSTSSAVMHDSEHTAALSRHFADLRDGTHGGARSQKDKERLFAAAVPLLDPYARQALEEINTCLLLGTGELTATGVRSSADGGLEAVWALSWPEQRAADLKPVIIRAY